jgi:hypothetical protein
MYLFMIQMARLRHQTLALVKTRSNLMWRNSIRLHRSNQKAVAELNELGFDYSLVEGHRTPIIESAT